jgi:hypothetical protein
MLTWHWHWIGLPSTMMLTLPLKYQPNEPVENSRGSACIGNPLRSTLSDWALAWKSSREIGQTVLGGMALSSGRRS